MTKIVNGNANNNNLNGSWGADSINGGLGADTMTGGGGNDIYIVDNPGDVVREWPPHQVNNDTAIQLVSVTTGNVIGNSHSGYNAITISGNGNLVGFLSNASNLLPLDANGAFVNEFNFRNMTTGAITTAHSAAGNVQVPQGAGGGPEAGYQQLYVTPNGQFAVFASSSVGLIPAADATTDTDIFVKNLVTGAITIESQPYGDGVSNGYHSTTPHISDNGRYVVFTATDNLVGATDGNGIQDTDVYWRDRQTGELRMVSGEFDGSVQGNSDSDNATVTNDGRLVLFESAGTNFTTPGFDVNGSTDLFIRDMVADTVQMITGAADNVSQANGSSYDASITPNGHYVVFTSSASNLVVGDTNGSADIFRQDLLTGNVIRVNTTSAGAQGGGGQHAQITPDGRYVVFESTATDLVTVAGDSNALTKIFVKDLVTGRIEMVSRTSTGGALTGYSAYAPQISDNGQFIVFNTRAVLGSPDSGTNEDVYRVPNPLYSPADGVWASVTYTLPAEVENLTLTGAAAINGTGNGLNNALTGNAANNVLSGLAGNDTINGGAGNDTMIGGTGNDVFVAGSSADVVTELAGQGTDTVQSAVAWTLGGTLENLTLTGAGNINGAGNAQGNVLTGNSGNNVLNGQAGNDTITGGAGDDILNGGAGEDSMAGGAGNDTYVRDAPGDVVTELAGQGNDLVQSSVGHVLGLDFERLTLTGAGHINGTGNALNNVLTGNAGNNVLNGGAGNDTMIGGAGNDTYVANAVGDIVTEAAGQGTDTVQSAIAWTLGSTLENLTLTGAGNINGTGNAQGNVLTGNSGNNVLNGGGGNDTISGGAGNDTMNGGAGNDTFVVNVNTDIIMEAAGQGTDTVQSAVAWTLGSTLENLTLTGAGNINGSGNSANNALTGNSGNNVLNGQAGNDTINGGAGSDALAGGGGNDTLVWDALDSSVNGGVGNDALRINGAGQTLDLAGLGGTKIVDVESINLTGSGANTLKVTLADVLAISSASDSLLVDGNSDDLVDMTSGGWSMQVNTFTQGANVYRIFTQGSATVLVDTDLMTAS